ncbi:MAG: cytochrome c biogenesis protein ResB [Nitriliruptorales bacterium]|nr:cytochrome c biogenesis protein ResB [Nitriliruptorales bacterium]
MRTALYLLGVLGFLSLVATVVPQAPNVPATVSAWRLGDEGPGPVVVGLIDAIGGFDVYGSALFLALLVLLFTSLTACLLPRYRAWWRVVTRSQPPRTRHVGHHDHVATLTTELTADEVDGRIRTVLADRRYRLRAADDDLPKQVAAERGLALREGGSLLFHTSFYVLLVGIVLGLLLGFEGDVAVVEGDAFADTTISYSDVGAGRWWDQADHAGFTLTLDQFEVDWFRDPRFGGTPTVFESTVTISEPDGATWTDTVGGNDPLVVDNMRIHQLAWGYAPRIVVEVDGEVVHDAHVMLVSTDAGVFQGAVKAPAADPDVGFDVLLWPYAPVDETTGTPVPTGAPWADAPLLVGVAYRGDLGLDSPQRFDTLDKTNLEQTGGAQLRPGAVVDLGDGVVISFPELRRWVGFQVSSKPTLPLLFIGGVLVLVGLVPAIYAWRRRVWAVLETDAAGGHTLITIAGRAFQRPQAFDHEFPAIVKAIRDATDADPSPTPVAASSRPVAVSRNQQDTS